MYDPIETLEVFYDVYEHFRQLEECWQSLSRAAVNKALLGDAYSEQLGNHFRQEQMPSYSEMALRTGMLASIGRRHAGDTAAATSQAAEFLARVNRLPIPEWVQS